LGENVFHPFFIFPSTWCCFCPWSMYNLYHLTYNSKTNKNKKETEKLKRKSLVQEE
jgi:hypothetical protein